MFHCKDKCVHEVILCSKGLGKCGIVKAWAVRLLTCWKAILEWEEDHLLSWSFPCCLAVNPLQSCQAPDMMERGWCLQMFLKYDPAHTVQCRPVLATMMSPLHNSPAAFIHRWSTCQKGISTTDFPISYFWSIRLFIPLLWIAVVGVGIRKEIFSGWGPKSSTTNQRCWQGWLFSNLN